MRFKVLFPVLLSIFLLPNSAFAAFHFIKIIEVFPGTVAEPNAQFVVLQAYSGGQNRVNGHPLQIFDAQNNSVGTFTFAADVANSANQMFILIATPEAEALFSITADLQMNGVIPLEGGKICFDEAFGANGVDCVAWGNFAGGGQVGTPFNGGSGLALSRAIKRSIERAGGADTLENGDDSNDSAADFFFADPTPINNAEDAFVLPPSTCGNNVVEGLEQCEDGNTAAGDGCDANCLFEIAAACGNGIVEAEASEQCDDGNLNNGDGCDNVCLVEAEVLGGACTISPAGNPIALSLLALLSLFGFIYVRRRS